MEVLREQYEKEVIPALMKKFEYKSVMQVPKLEKIVINIGLGDTKDNPKALDNAIADLTAITGQKPVITKARKSIAAFKLREGANIGCKVTLRSDKMYDFAYKLFNVALPRVRDFRGVSGVLDETHPQYGLYRFKKGFNAEFTEFIGEIYFDFKPFVYKTYKVSEKIFKKTRGFIRRLKGEVK